MIHPGLEEGPRAALGLNPDTYAQLAQFTLVGYF